MFKCKECEPNFNSQSALEDHLNKYHLQSKSTDTQSHEDNTCPICSKGFMSKESMHDHFKESHMNPIDIRKNQTLSDLITDEAKEIVIESKTEEMTLEEYDKVLDKYEALYCTEDEDSENDTSKT